MIRGMPRLQLRVRKDGPAYYAKFRDAAGKDCTRLIGPAWEKRSRPAAGFFTESQARAEMDMMIAAELSSSRPFLVANVVERWIEHGRVVKALSPSTILNYRSMARVDILPAFGDRVLGEISAQDIEAWKERLRARVQPSCVNKSMKAFNAVFVYAQKVLGYAGANPLKTVDYIQTGYRGELDFYSPEEVWALVRAAQSEREGALYLLAALSGLRLGELLALRWRDVDYQSQSILVRRNLVRGVEKDTKGRRMRSVPLADPVSMALARMQGADDGLVFDGVGATTVTARYKAAQKKAQLRALRFHDLRHTFGTTLARNGADVLSIKTWLGHSSTATTEVYLHYKPKLRESEFVTRAFALESVAVEVE